LLFHTIDYLVFLPLAVLIYWGLERRFRLWWLFAASILFYASWSLIYLPVMLLVVGVGWLGGEWLAGWRRWSGHALRRSVVLLVLLLPLLFFKYWDWIAQNIEALVDLLGGKLGLPRVALPLPVGISFFTFQALAYVVDVGRAAEKGKDEAEHDFPRFFTFQAFFPQLVAGPIVRATELLPDLKRLPALREGQVADGIFRICTGMAKKLLVADVMRLGMVDPVFTDPGSFTSVEKWFALYAYTLEIYADFSGYSDIAIGSAKLFGFELPENFKRPYKATSVSDFWRRWHITLSDWIRDYLYFPLGGSKGGPWRTRFNLVLTLVIIGLWHRASWNFALYGLMHGLVMVLERAEREFRARRGWGPGGWPSLVARWLFTFHFVVLARILFRTANFEDAVNYAGSLGELELILPRYSPTVWGVFFLGWLVHFSPDGWKDTIRDRFGRLPPVGWALVSVAVAAAAFAMGSGEQLAFVYYQF
jgi:alginate O-acetyltransferase complex protein AlgI